jgi:hypothetical protein
VRTGRVSARNVAGAQQRRLHAAFQALLDATQDDALQHICTHNCRRCSARRMRHVAFAQGTELRSRAEVAGGHRALTRFLDATKFDECARARFEVLAQRPNASATSGG